MRQRKSYQQEIWLNLDNERVKVVLTASKRRSIRLQVNSDGDIDLRVPLGTPQADVMTFVSRHKDWLNERREAVRKRDEKRAQSLKVYGRDLPFVESALGEFLVTGDQIWIPDHWNDEQREKALDKWQRSEARSCFEALIERWWPVFGPLGHERPALRIKRMRTRWGSLSRKGNINLNLALLALPEDLIELVVVHELCHLEHFNHGAGFKALMTRCLPDWRERDRRINQEGLELL
ncbi:MAG: SprT-like domain-containing protein [Thalassolituus sp.]